MFTGGFKGKCNKCGKWGHKAKDCHSNGNNNNGNNNGKRFTGKCNYCNKVGHKEAACWKKQRDEKAGEKANTAIDNEATKEDVVLMAFDDDHPWCTKCSNWAGHKKRDHEEVNEINEEEGPVNDWKLKSVRTNELDYDCFYLGLREYKFEFIPNAKGKMPENPRKKWNLGEQYDKPTGWQHEEMEFERELRKWKIENLLAIKKLNYQELARWKKAYKKNAKRDIALPMVDSIKGKDSNIYIGDSGASCHMVNSEDGMFDCQEIDEYVTVGNGGKVKATKIGKKKVTLKQKDGTTTNVLLKHVKLVPDLAPYYYVGVK